MNAAEQALRVGTPSLQKLATLTLLVHKGDAYDHHVATFHRWMTERGLDDPYRAVADYFRDLNQNSAYSAGTIRIKRQAVKSRLRLMALAARMTPNDQYQLETFMAQLDRDTDTKAPKLNSAAVGQSKTLTESEYDRLVVGARSERQGCFIRFLWQTGCRVSEMCGAELRNCRREGDVIHIRVMGKGRKEREILVRADLFERILEVFGGDRYLIETAGGKRYDRSYISRQIAKLGRQILGRTISAHKLRHSFATRMIAKTHKISAVSKYLGHSSVSTTLAMYNHEELDLVELFGSDIVR